MNNQGNQQYPEIQRYCNSLEEIKIRIKTIQSIVNDEVPINAFGHDNFVDEFIFMQIRKILELIAFGSMLNNIDLYKETYEKYRTHWRMSQIFENLEKINPDFYPIPLKKSKEVSSKSKQVLEVVTHGFLNKDDFLDLYNISSKVIHSPKPFSEEKIIDVKKSVDEWVHQITSLLWFHQIKLANSQEWWLVYLVHPDNGNSYAVKATTF